MLLTLTFPVKGLLVKGYHSSLALRSSPFNSGIVHTLTKIVKGIWCNGQHSDWESAAQVQLLISPSYCNYFSYRLHGVSGNTLL